MNEVLNFLNECGVFYVSTVEGNAPKVRPFSFVMEYDGKLCFCTSNQKPFYNQLMSNPNIEICATTKDMRWVRLSGKAEFCTSTETKTKVLEVAPSLKNMYSVDDSIFEVFYLKDAVANFFSFSGDNKTITL
jgi:uncharacterized pyridoxamine 5'-phosphate oxidase family protein